ncbi:MAG: hypothetical protein CM1200mP41_19470 [Gammaproteobacteria bacterium]|nr:MAG: hypothetical protein CM1200mP41_19470 [Gammaproteobacteria bacterium]
MWRNVERLSDGVFVGEYGMVQVRRLPQAPQRFLLSVAFVWWLSLIDSSVCLPITCRRLASKPRNAALLWSKAGHFRAGFLHLFEPKQVLEIDVPGLTSPNWPVSIGPTCRGPSFPWMRTHNGRQMGFSLQPGP